MATFQNTLSFDRLPDKVKPRNGYDSETELLSRSGWRRFDRINPREHVATFRMSDGCIEFEPLDRMVAFKYNGPVISFKTTRSNFCVLPGHRMVVKSYKAKRSKFVAMNSVCSRAGNVWFPVCLVGHDRDFSVGDDELRFLGWVMTDGSCPQGIDMRIHQSKPKNLLVIRQMLDRLGVEFGETSRMRPPPIICGVQVKGRLRAHLFSIRRSSSKHFFELMPDKKRLPDWMFYLSQRQVAVFLDTLMQGDGSFGRGNFRELNGTESFLGQVQSLLLANNISSRVRTNCRGDFVLSIRRFQATNLRNSLKSISIPRYRGMIWNAFVGNNTIVTRRHGVPLISGCGSAA